MPKTTGLEVLDWIRQQPHFKSLPVLMFTSSTRPDDMENARRLGADDYLLKPSDPLKLVDIVKSLHDHWLSRRARRSAKSAARSAGLSEARIFFDDLLALCRVLWNKGWQSAGGGT